MADYLAMSRERVMSICEELAGPALAEMLSNRSRAETYLDRTDSNLRRAALLLIGVHWSPTPEFRSACARMMLVDRDIAVRLAALEVLVSTCAEPDADEQLAYIVGGPSQPAEKEAAETADQLARIVCDSSEPLDIRKHAYTGLFLIYGRCLRQGRRLSRWMDAWSEAQSPEFRIPDHIDWPFVRSFLK